MAKPLDPATVTIDSLTALPTATPTPAGPPVAIAVTVRENDHTLKISTLTNE